jgi:FixJ family two-component response regulator
MQDCRKGSRSARADTGHHVRQVFYADGEIASTKAIRAALEHLGAEVTHFHGVQDCLESLKTRSCHLLVSNARRPAVEGVALLRGAKQIRPFVPVVVLVDYGDIPTAIRVIKGGAADCLERPPMRASLTSALDAALQESSQNDPPGSGPLTKTERHVLYLILQGCTTGRAARILHRSKRTIEVHRSHIMRKLNVDTMVNLVRRCARLGLLRDWP